MKYLCSSLCLGLALACASVQGGEGTVSLDAYGSYLPDRRDYMAFRQAHPELLEPNYLAFMVHRFPAGGPVGDALVFCRWPDERMPLKVFIETPTIPDELQNEFSRPVEPATFSQAVERALETWEEELEDKVRFERAGSPQQADLRIRVLGRKAPVPEPTIQVLGSTEALRHACRSRGWDPEEERLIVSFAVSELIVYVADEFGLLTDTQVEGVALHEIGHALGMRGHSPLASDLMYPVADDGIVGGGLSRQDINSFVSLYSVPNGSHYGWVSAGDPAPRPPPLPPSGAPMLALAPHVDTRFGFALRTPAEWIGVETRHGFFAANGPLWDHDASIEVVVRPYDTVAEFLDRFSESLFYGTWLRHRGTMVVNGRPAVQIATEDARGHHAQEYILIELGDGRVMLVLTQCPASEQQAWQPWLRASLGSLDIWSEAGDSWPGSRRSRDPGG